MAEAVQSKWEKIWMPLLPALLALCGVAMGAGINQYWSAHAAREKDLLELRLGAYRAFFTGQAKLQEARQSGDPQATQKLEEEYRLAVKDAKFQIAVFGTKPVVEAMTDYFRKYFPTERCGGSAEMWRDDIRTYQQMRREVFGGDASQRVDDATLLLLLFNCQPSP